MTEKEDLLYQSRADNSLLSTWKALKDIMNMDFDTPKPAPEPEPEPEPKDTPKPEPKDTPKPTPGQMAAAAAERRRDAQNGKGKKKGGKRKGNGASPALANLIITNADKEEDEPNESSNVVLRAVSAIHPQVYLLLMLLVGLYLGYFRPDLFGYVIPALAVLYVSSSLVRRRNGYQAGYLF